MKLYHADRHNRLDMFIGQIIPLVDNVISIHGLSYSQSIPLDGSSDCNTMLIEHFFELVREARYPNMPSRFISFFACEHEGLLAWKEPLRLTGDSAIYEVEGSDQYRVDGRLLTIGLYNNNKYMFNPKYANLFANTYWQQSSSENLHHSLSQDKVTPFPPPQWEYLVQFPVQILRKLSKDEVADALGLKADETEVSKNP